LGWTQQQLADKLNHVSWTQGQGRAAVNADMMAKWERGVKGLSPRYRALLCQLFGVTAEQLGFAPAWVSSWRLPLLRRARCADQRRLHLLAPSIRNDSQIGRP
jgi:transcriptional regulator with XRE-family HTH domain